MIMIPSNPDRYRSVPACLRLPLGEQTCCGGSDVGYRVRELDLTGVDRWARRAPLLRAAEELTFTDCLRVRVRSFAWAALTSLLPAGFRYQVLRPATQDGSPREITIHIWRFLDPREQERYHRSALTCDPVPFRRTS